ncbi:MAG: T9SS type A sorting domain-containing protein [Bacteroidetes bacterium]|nr:T9SS type A sorting domain-containing protein [Bacteroidota bacterium]
MLWDLTVPSGDVRCRDYIITDKNIFVTWQHTLHGGGYYSFNATNINKSSGNIKWQSAYKFTGVGLPASHSGGSASATSIDLDRNNNVYLTGYYGDANYGPECWGILKLDSNTGDALYEVTITEDSSYYDDISIGLAACYINDAPYFVGELQTGFEIGNKKSKTTLIKLNEESGKVIRKKYVSGSYQYPSQTQQIEKFGDYNTIILKRLGRRTILELYNVNNNLSWDKLFNSSYLLIPEELSFIDNHTIIFTASGYDKVNTNVLDSIYVYFINKYGLLKETYKFHIGTEYAHPIEILNNGTNSFVFYEKMNNLFYRKIDENGLSSEYDLNININNIITQSKYTVSNSDSTTLIFGMKDYCNRMIELNNTTHDTNDKVCFPDIQQINYVSKSINNSIIICGNDYNDNELIKSINLVTFETNWTNTFTTGKNTLKFVIDEDSSYLYTIGYHDNYSTVRKINPHNGLESWEYLFKEDTFNIESPTDIDYDKNRSHLIITGFTRDGSKELNNSNVVIGIIDTSANIISTYTRSGDFKGENMGICANVLHDGSIWAGGRLNHSEYGKAGFIYELDSGFINGWDENISKPELNNIQIIAYPNPFAEYVNVEFNVPENNSTIILELYNMNGELFYLHQANKVPVGKYNFKINLINNSGLYLLKLQINKSISYQKLIRIE